jgi:hypothetical protein
MKLDTNTQRIHNFLLSNGYQYEMTNEGVAYHKSGYSDIEINDNEVVFVSDIGDYAHFPVNAHTVYTLIGFMLVGRQLDISFKY